MRRYRNLKKTLVCPFRPRRSGSGHFASHASRCSEPYTDPPEVRSERIRAHFHEMFVANVGEELANLTEYLAEFPEDLEAWV